MCTILGHICIYVKVLGLFISCTLLGFVIWSVIHYLGAIIFNIWQQIESVNDVQALYSLDAEFSSPLWVFGINSYELIQNKEGRNLIACSYRSFCALCNWIFQICLSTTLECPVWKCRTSCNWSFRWLLAGRRVDHILVFWTVLKAPFLC